MSEDPFVLLDELLETAEQWQQVALEYERHATDFLNSFWPFGSGASSADLGAGTQLIVHLAQLQVMRAWLRMIEDLLTRAEDARLNPDPRPPQRVFHTSPVEGVDGPEPF